MNSFGITNLVIISKIAFNSYIILKEGGGLKYGSVRESTESQITQDNQISHFNKTFYYNLGEGEGVGEMRGGDKVSVCMGKYGEKSSFIFRETNFRQVSNSCILHSSFHN